MTFTRNWYERSPEAEAEGVCHTKEECKQMYAELAPALKEKAIRWFLKFYAEQLPKIAESMAKDGEHWIAPYHLGWGMNVRNNLRQHGFGEQEFGIDNLDCIYRQLVEEAIYEWHLEGY